MYVCVCVCVSIAKYLLTRNITKTEMDNLITFRNETSKYLNTFVAEVEESMKNFSEISVTETQKRFTDYNKGKEFVC